MKLFDCMKWVQKYNTVKIEKEELEKAYSEEIKKLLIENNNLKIENKDFRKKLTSKNKQIKELREIIRSDKNA